MNKDYSTFGGMYGVDTPVQGTFCTQPNGQQGVINDRGQCVGQAPVVSPSTTHLYNINNVPNPEYNLNSSWYAEDAANYITNVVGVDPNSGLKPGYSGQEQSAIMDKAQQEVERAYQLYLGRGSDPGGLDYYSQKIKSAAMRKDYGAITAVMDEIKNSPEGQNYAASQANPPPPVETPVEPPTVEPPVIIDCAEGQTLNENGECVSSGPTNLPVGTFLGQQCSGTTMITMYADGEGGSTQTQAANSTECGYSAPPPPPAPVPGVNLGFDTSTYTSPVSSGVGTVTGNTGGTGSTGGTGIGSVTGYDYTPYQASRNQRVDYVKMLQGWLTNSLFQDII